MLSTKRKPFSPVDSNRLLQQPNKRPYKQRRKTNGSSTIKSGNSSLASLVDDIELDFLSNPKQVPTLIVRSAETEINAATKPLLQKAEVIWNSTSKTPKISNLTTLMLSQTAFPGKVEDNVPLSSKTQGMSVTGATNAALESFSKQRVPRPKKVPQFKTVVNDFESSTNQKCNRSIVGGRTMLDLPPHQRSRRRFKKSRDNDHSSIASKSSHATGGSLETIHEGTYEQESDSPDSLRDNETKRHEKVPDIIITPKITTIVSDQILKRSPPEDATQNVQTKIDPPTIPLETTHQVDNRCYDEGSNHASDMDESSDDDLMGLTLSPPVDAPETANDNAIKKGEEKPSLSMSPSMCTQPEPQVQPMSKQPNDHHGADQLRHSQPQVRFHTPTARPNQRTEIALQKSTPHPVMTVRFRHNPPKHPHRRLQKADLETTAELSATRKTVVEPSLYSQQIIEFSKKDAAIAEIINNIAAQQQAHASRMIPYVETPNSHIRCQQPQSDGQKQRKYSEEARSNEYRLSSIARQSLSQNDQQLDNKVTSLTNLTLNNWNISSLPKATIMRPVDGSPLHRPKRDFMSVKISQKLPENNVTKPKGVEKPDAIQGAHKKRLVIEPLDKQVWEAMMVKPENSKTDISGILGLIIETPARAENNNLEESESIDGSEITQDTFFLLDRTKPSDQDREYHSRGTSPLRAYFMPNSAQQEEKSRMEFKSTGNEAVKVVDACRTAENLDSLVKMDIADGAMKHVSKMSKILRSPHTQNIQPSSNFTEPRTIKTIEIGLENRNTSNVPRPLSEYGTTPSSAANHPISAFKYRTSFRKPKLNVDSYHIDRNKRRFDDLDGNASPATHRTIPLLQEDVYSGILSTATKRAVPSGIQPKMWTAEIAGSRIKALGVNAAPVFRLDPGKYFQHPPLPPGWTVAVSRSQNIPFYIHPDFGATFYSPVPLPSGDGTTAGTTLLYQADTPVYRQPASAFSRSPATSTPIMFGLTRSSEKTSSVISQIFEKTNNETPLGALIVATNIKFSESQNGMQSSLTLQQEKSEAVPLFEPSSNSANINRDGIQVTSPTQSISMCSRNSGSGDSSTTVTLASNHLRQRGIPNEIEIAVKPDNVVDDDKFQMDLDASARNEKIAQSFNLLEAVNDNVVDEDKFQMDRDALARKEKISQSVNLLEAVDDQSTKEINFGSKIARIESKSSNDSEDGSLEWVAGISLGISENETPNLHCKKQSEGNQNFDEEVALHQHQNEDRLDFICSSSQPKTPDLNSIPGTRFLCSGEELQNSIDSDSNDDIHVSTSECEHSPSIPHKVIIGPNIDEDDMSLLQSSPLRNEDAAMISTRFNPRPARSQSPFSDDILLSINQNDQDENNHEYGSHGSVASKSYASGRSSLSRASRRSLNPLLPICSLQNLHAIKAAEKSSKNYKKKPKKQPRERSSTIQTIPVSA
jgi:hypothetical protein